MNSKSFDKYYGLGKELYDIICNDYINTRLPKIKIAEIYEVDGRTVYLITHKLIRKHRIFNYDKEFSFTDKGDGMFCDFDINPILGYHA